jgi:hypothetical protein
MRWHVAVIFCLMISMFVAPRGLESAQAGTRCGFYAGIGYHCFGTDGGTGGKVFHDMRQNSRRCGYFDPGCQSRTNRGVAPRQR